MTFPEIDHFSTNQFLPKIFVWKKLHSYDSLFIDSKIHDNPKQFYKVDHLKSTSLGWGGMRKRERERK